MFVHIAGELDDKLVMRISSDVAIVLISMLHVYVSIHVSIA